MQGQLTVSGLAVRDASGKLKRVARLAFNYNSGKHACAQAALIQLEDNICAYIYIYVYIYIYLQANSATASTKTGR